MSQLTDSQLHEIEHRGKRAKEILNDPIFKAAFMQMQAKLLMEFQDSDLKNDEARLNAWQQGQILKDFEKQFTTLMKQGDNAKITLMERAKAHLRRII